MAAQKPTSEQLSFISWFEKFIKSELAPYPGRGAAVARMVIAATLTMLLIMTFRINDGALGTIYAFLISRQSMRSTLQSGVAIVISYSAGVVFVFCGAAMFADQQSRSYCLVRRQHACYFLCFTDTASDRSSNGIRRASSERPTHLADSTDFRVSCGTNSMADTGRCHRDDSNRICRSSFPCLMAAKRSDRSDKRAFGGDTPLVFIRCKWDIHTSRSLRAGAMRYSIVGTSGLRSALARISHEGTAFDRWSTTIALVGRIVDLGVNATVASHLLTEKDYENFRRLEGHLRKILSSWGAMREQTHQIQSQTDRVASLSCIPQLPELHRSLSMLAQVCGEADVAVTETTVSDCDERTRFKGPGVGAVRFSLFVPDAFRNQEHLMFAVRGCLATTLCYLIYEHLIGEQSQLASQPACSPLSPL